MVHYALTGERLHDAEVQSIQHEMRHEVEDTEAYQEYSQFDTWPKKDQIAAWRDVLSRVETIPSHILSDQDKYRVSHKQPGIVTRLKQEITRLESGVHEGTGKELNSDQVNTGADMLATMRMLSALERNTPARKNFLESNARRRGITFQQAEGEWNSLMNKPRKDEKGKIQQISLTDDYRKTMSVAGIDAQDQANLGQSGRARAAMAVMEQRAQKHLASIDSKHRRPALREEHVRGRYEHPDSPKAKLKCGLCGQFGHEDNDCPNGDHLATLEECAELQERLAAHSELNSKKAAAQKAIDGSSEDRAAFESTLQKAGLDWTAEDYLADVDKRTEQLGEPLMSPPQVAKLTKQAEREQEEAHKAIDASGVKISSMVQEASYNPDNGLLRVTYQPYQKKNGEVSVYPPRYFRARPEEVDAMLNNPSIGKGVHEQMLEANKTKTIHEFENAAELEAAKSELKCPTCGQWASMNSIHKCPVPGGPSEEFDIEKRRVQMDYRALARSARAEDQAAPPKPLTIEKALHHSEPVVNLPNPQVPGETYAGALRSGTRANAQNAIDSGRLYTSSVSFTATDDSCRITGEVSAWRDDEGNRMLSIYSSGGSKGLQCSCSTFAATGRCPHVNAVGTQLLQKYEAAPARRGSRPGMSLASIRRGRSEDAAVMAPNRLSYSEIAELRRKATNEYAWADVQRRKANKLPGQWTRGKPTDRNGVTIEHPSVWERDPNQTEKPGAPVNLSDHRAVRDRLRSLSQSKGGRGNRVPYSVTLDPDKSGAILVNIPPSAMKAGNEATARAHRRRLAKMLNVSEHAITARGFRVSPNPAARHNALDRMAGDPTRITPPTYAYTPSNADLRAAERRHQFGNDGSFVG